MIRRKIQRTGIATYTVSLPKTWVTRNEVQPGDSIFITEEADQSLLLGLEKSTETIKEETLDLSKYPHEAELIRKFISLYLNGVHKVTFNSSQGISKDVRKQIFDQTKKVIGFEIVEETREKIVLQDFFSATSFSLQNVIRRAFQLSQLMIEESLKILQEEVEIMDSINLWEEEVNRIYLLARRQINFALHNSPIMNKLNITVDDCQDFIIIIGAIEKMADSFVRIAKNCLKVKKTNKEINTFAEQKFNQIIDVYDLALQCYFKRDFTLSNQVISTCEQLGEEIINLEKYKLLEEDKTTLYLILSTLKSKTNLINEIAEIGLDRS